MLDLGAIAGAPRADALGILRHRGVEVFDAGPRIAPERDLRLQGASDLLGDDLEMDDALAAWRHGVALARDLTELAANHQKRVGLRDQRIGDAVVAAEEAGA